jgi:hypothetical protein
LGTLDLNIFTPMKNRISLTLILPSLVHCHSLSENDPLQAQITMREFQFFESIIEKQNVLGL